MTMPQVEIRIKGQIDERWSEWLEGLKIVHSDQAESMLSGEVADQAALYGLIARLRDLGLPLLAVKLIDAPESVKSADKLAGSAHEAAPATRRGTKISRRR
jgi:hypothetical protein